MAYEEHVDWFSKVLLVTFARCFCRIRLACRSNIQNALTFQDRPWLRIFPYLISAIKSYPELPAGDAADAPIFVGQGAFPSCTWLLATTVDYWFLLPLESNPQLHPQYPPLSFVLPLLLSLASFLPFVPFLNFQLHLPSGCMELEV